MSQGPITIFDKSAIQMLNIDESALLGQFYRVAITPLFYVETLADLEKEIDDGKTPEDVVGIIASKTTNLTADPSAHHRLLTLNDLHGGEIEMRGRPHVVGGRSVVRDGKRGIVFAEAPEAEALHRWQKHEFLEIERGIAKQWREGLRAQQIRKLDPAEYFPQKRPRALAEVKGYADAYVRRRGGAAFLSALNVLAVPGGDRGPVLMRWLDLGAPPIAVFAPYAAYVATVTLFFELAVALSMISDQRPSNAVDIAYLFYLPFCQMFTSRDKLHLKTVPLFLRADQVFVSGEELKTDLKKLDEYFSAQPAEVLEHGVMHFEPPFDGDYLTTGLWKKFLPGWKDPRERSARKVKPEHEAKVVAEFNQLSNAPAGPPVDGDDADFLVIHRSYPVKMGKWQIVAQDVAERSWAHEAAKRSASAAARPTDDKKP